MTDLRITGTIETDYLNADLLRELTETPRGFQIKRTKGWRMPAKSVRVMRPGLFGNPFLVSVYGQEQAIERHRAWLEAATAEELGYTGSWADMLNTLRAKVMERLPDLRGRNLGCSCPEPKPGEQDNCHRATLLKMANANPGDHP